MDVSVRLPLVSNSNIVIIDADCPIFMKVGMNSTELEDNLSSTLGLLGPTDPLSN